MKIYLKDIEFVTYENIEISVKNNLNFLVTTNIQTNFFNN